MLFVPPGRRAAVPGPHSCSKLQAPASRGIRLHIPGCQKPGEGLSIFAFSSSLAQKNPLSLSLIGSFPSTGKQKGIFCQAQRCNVLSKQIRDLLPCHIPWQQPGTLAAAGCDSPAEPQDPTVPGKTAARPPRGKLGEFCRC